MALAGHVGRQRAAPPTRPPLGQVARRGRHRHGRRLLGLGGPHHAPARGASGSSIDEASLAAVGCCRCAWVGATLLLSELRWFRRQPLVERLRPYAPGGWAGTGGTGVLSVASFREVIGPLARAVGERLAALARRRARTSPSGSSGSTRRSTPPRSASASSAGAVVGVRRRAPSSPPSVGRQAPLLALAASSSAAPLLAFLIVEQQLATPVGPRGSAASSSSCPSSASSSACCSSAGYSLGAALNRLAARGHGAVRHATCRRRAAASARALRGRRAARVGDRRRRRRRSTGSSACSPSTARPATSAGSSPRRPASIRRDVQRELIEPIERRAQQVWIPVTVATLVPGVIFLAVPFIEALRLFSST